MPGCVIVGIMRWSGASVRRAVCLTLALELAWPAGVAAAPDEDVMVLVARAQQEINAARAPNATDSAKRYETAAELFGRAADRMPEFEENRVYRADLLRKAVSAYRVASERGGDNPAPLRHAHALAVQHVEALERVYGRSAGKMTEHVRASEFRDQLAARLKEIDPSFAAQEPQPEQPKFEPPQPVPHAAEQPAVPSNPVINVEPSHPASEDARRGKKIGLGVSLGLTGVSLGAVIGTAVVVTNSPFQGRLYRNIHEAVQRTGTFVGPDDDMCGAWFTSVSQDVADACAARDRVARAAVAMTVLTVAFAASSVAFGVLLQRSKRADVARFRQHRPGLGFGPTAGGGVVVVGARF